MSNVFEVTDKTGRKIILNQEKWSYILKHKGMEQHLENIKKALQNPTLIVPHKFHQHKSNYYTYFKQKKRYLLVSVNYLNGEGEVVTAFITRKIIKR